MTDTQVALIMALRWDDASLSLADAVVMAQRIEAHPAVRGACVHRMPQGSSAFGPESTCVRCGAHKLDRFSVDLDSTF